MPNLPPRIHVEWCDPDPFPRGHPVRGGYVETFWTPLVGPTAIALTRRLAYRLDAAGAISRRAGRPGTVGVTYDLSTLAAEVGVTAKVASARLGSLVRRGLIERDGPASLRLAARWPLVGPDDLDDLPTTLRPYARPPERAEVA